MPKVIYPGYKEPLTPVKDGYGYMGCIGYTEDMKELQCHICGETFPHLSHHIARHKIKVKEYKKKYQLSMRSALVSKEISFLYAKRFVTTDPHLRKKQRMQLAEARRARRKERRKGGMPVSLEQKNKEGRCPDQLIDKIKKLTKKLNHPPRVREFIAEYGSLLGIQQTFGTYKAALKLAGYDLDSKDKYTREQLIKFLQNYYEQFGHSPKTYAFGRSIPGIYNYYRFWETLNDARMAAGIPIYLPRGKWQYVEVEVINKKVCNEE